MIRQFGAKPVHTLVVWEPVLLTDWSSPSTMTLGRISNSRAEQFWDKHRVVSHAMGEHDRESIVWDYAAVFPRGATWTDRAPRALYEGGPVVRVIDETRRAVSQALAEPAIP